MKYFKQNGFKDKKNDFINYHIDQITATRSWLYNFNESPYFNLNTTTDIKDPRAKFFLLAKTRPFIKALMGLKVENWMQPVNEHFLKPTINDTHLYDLPVGFKIAKQYLE